MECLTPAPRDAWAELTARNPEALPFHRPEWLDAIVASGGYVDASRLYVDGSTRAVLPLARRTGLLGRVGLLASLPYGWGFGGLLANGPLDERQVAAARFGGAVVGRSARERRPGPEVGTCPLARRRLRRRVGGSVHRSSSPLRTDR
jgi:hypothetical protein